MAKHKAPFKGVTQAQPSSLFSIIFSTTTLIVFAIQIFRAKNISESIDKTIFALSVLIGGYLFLKSFGKKIIGTQPLVFSVLAFLVAGIGILGIEKHPTMDPNFLSTLWLGFGWPVLLLALMLLPFIFSIFMGGNSSQTIKWSFRVFSFAIVLLTLPAIMQGGGSIIDPYHSEYVLNELLSVAAGNIPYVDFIPQYGQLYSWLLAPLASFASANTLVTTGLYLMSIGTFIALAIGVWLVHRALGSKSLSLAILLVIPFTSLAQFPGRKEYAGTIYDLLSAVPGRILPGMVVGLLTVNFLVSQKKSKVLIYVLGFVSGIGLWINQDFTFAAGIIAMIAVMIFASSNKPRMYFLLGYSLGLFSYPLALAVTGRTLRLDSIGFFIIQYTSGYMAEPIQTPGPVLVVLPLIIAITYASLQPLFKQKFKRTELPLDQYRALVTASFFSSWSVISFAYYLNRSYASGQLQILLLPLSVASASFFYYLVLRNEGNAPWTGKTFFQSATWKKHQAKQSASYLVIALLMSLPLATVIAFPSPSIEIGRLTNADTDHKWPFEATTSAVNRINTASKTIPIENIGYLGNSGNYIELVTGAKSANLLNSPWDMPPAAVPLRLGCAHIELVNRDYLVVDDVAKRVQDLFASKKICDRYGNSLAVPSVSPYLLTRIPG